MYQQRSAIYLLVLLLDTIAAQASSPKFVKPQDCDVNSIFDVVRLRCITCENGTQANRNHDQCVCPNGLVRTSTGCQPCGSGKKVSDDGYFCINCQVPSVKQVGANNQSAVMNDKICSKCPTGYASFRSRSENGELLQIECLKCPNNFRTSPTGDYCIPCNAQSDACECHTNVDDCRKLNRSMASTIKLEDGIEKRSPYIESHLNEAVYGCTKGNLQSCQHLANICVLQNYRTQTPSACTAFEEIGANRRNQWSNDYFGDLKILYHNTEPAIELTRTNAIRGQFSFRAQQPNSQLDIVLAQYTVDGQFVGFQWFNDSDWNACPSGPEIFRFGALIRMRCLLTPAALLRESRRSTVTLYDLYLVYTDFENSLRLYPIPVLNENIRRADKYVNRIDGPELFSSKWVLSRRIYFFDALMLDSSTANSSFIRLPTRLSIFVQIQPYENGLIMPPYVRVRHIPTLRSSPNPISFEFEITYFMDGSVLAKDIEIILIVLSAISIIYAALAAYSWARRSGKLIIDGMTILKFLLLECDLLADIMLTVISIAAVFITLSYKAQRLPFYVVLNKNQEWKLLSYLFASVVLKLLSVVHRSAQLILTDTFFIDWEKSKLQTSDDVRLVGSNQAQYITSPVIWRTYLIANEWNELQTYRKTSTGAQMVIVLALFNWLKFDNFATVAPNFELDVPDSYTSTMLSRFAVTSCIYWLVAIIQWIFNVVVIERLVVDPFRNMIDLCSIANISIFSLTHPLHGYYIHGRSVHGKADADMAEINEYLCKEQDNLCGQRGLEAGSDLQTYIINLPKAFLEQFKLVKKISTGSAQKLRLTSSDTTSAEVEKKAKIHQQINQFLLNFIEHSNPQVNYTIRDASLFEYLTDIEFVDTSQIGTFSRPLLIGIGQSLWFITRNSFKSETIKISKVCVSRGFFADRDKSEVSYSRAFVYGNEWTFLSFEYLLFSIIDLFVRNYACAALCTFAFSSIFKLIISVLFTNHLIRSSFIDQRFLT